MKNIRVVIATFKNKISEEELPFFEEVSSVCRGMNRIFTTIWKKVIIMPILWFNISV